MSDAVWAQFNQPADSSEDAILKLRSVMQRAVPTYLIEVNQKERPQGKQNEKKIYLKFLDRRKTAKFKEAGERYRTSVSSLIRITQHIAARFYRDVIFLHLKKLNAQEKTYLPYCVT